MKMKITMAGLRASVLSTVIAAAATACGTDATAPALDVPAALLSVQPAGGSTNVSVGSDVVITFDHAIAEGMEEYAALHEGSVTGPEVEGTWTRSADGMTLTFAPDAALKPATTYTLHVGGGMMDEDGHTVDLDMHGMGMGGEWATESMMTGGMGSGMGGMGGMGGEPGTHMGTGWQHPSNGTYGMVFSFTTAG
jgi:hypothetical protein